MRRGVPKRDHAHNDLLNEHLKARAAFQNFLALTADLSKRHDEVRDAWLVWINANARVTDRAFRVVEAFREKSP